MERKPVFKTEAQAWDAVAETMAWHRSMPLTDCGYRMDGLCAVAHGMHEDGLINRLVRDLMVDRINAALYENMPERYNFFGLSPIYLCPPYRSPRRIVYARQFAQDARREARLEARAKARRR